VSQSSTITLGVPAVTDVVGGWNAKMARARAGCDAATIAQQAIAAASRARALPGNEALRSIRERLMIKSVGEDRVVASAVRILKWAFA
jgi:hypothetical protein